MERIRPFFPKERGVPRVDDRKVLSGIIHVYRRVALALQGVDPLRLNAGTDNFAKGIADFIVFPGTCRG